MRQELEACKQMIQAMQKREESLQAALTTANQQYADEHRMNVELKQELTSLQERMGAESKKVGAPLPVMNTPLTF